MEKTSQTAKKALFFIVLAFFVGFFIYKPYTFSFRTIDGFFEHLFSLYFFIVNQTLGIVHEAGHGICYILPCPQFFMVLNGTIFQWLFPLGVGFYYKKRGNFLAWHTALFFLGISMQYTAWYISTSHHGLFIKAQNSFLGVDGYHDFNYMLSKLGILKSYSLIAGFVEFFATLLMAYGLFRIFLEAFISSK